MVMATNFIDDFSAIADLVQTQPEQRTAAEVDLHLDFFALLMHCGIDLTRDSLQEKKQKLWNCKTEFLVRNFQRIRFELQHIVESKPVAVEVWV